MNSYRNGRCHILESPPSTKVKVYSKYTGALTFENLRAERDQEWNFCSHSLSTHKLSKVSSTGQYPGLTGRLLGDEAVLGNAGGGQGTTVEMKLMLKKMEALEKLCNRNNEMVLEQVADMHHAILSLSVSHSRSHVQTVERIEELAARLDLAFMQQTSSTEVVEPLCALWDSDLAAAVKAAPKVNFGALAEVPALALLPIAVV